MGAPSAVRSADGTMIAAETVGHGPALVVVDGALCARHLGPSRALARELASDFTVWRYDRRGRGTSGDRAPYAVAREVEDLAAVARAATRASGSAPVVLGLCTGGALALEAAADGVPMNRLAVYEPPYVGMGGTSDPREHLDRLLAAGQHGAALRYFFARYARVNGFEPRMALRALSLPAAWPQLTAMAPTLAYDVRIMGTCRVPVARLRWVDVPTLVLGGAASRPELREAVQRVAAAIPGARAELLPGAKHDLPVARVAAALREFASLNPPATARLA